MHFFKFNMNQARPAESKKLAIYNYMLHLKPYDENQYIMIYFT